MIREHSQDASVAARLLGMEELTRRLLKLFIEMGSESLDLHTLFEAGGNDPESRKRVLDVVTGSAPRKVMHAACMHAPEGC